MSNQNMMRVVMNATRLRIIQYLTLHETATAGQIKEELTDIPPASLYRHIKMLEEAKLIHVVKENKVRGTMEKVYQLNKESPLNGDTSNKAINQIVQSGLLSIMSEFARYLDNEENDMRKDLLFLTTSTLLLSDEEFMEFTEEMSAAIQKVINNKKNEERKVRRITFISSPCEE
ncbi:helix-turn-helix domain-containing protein [Konateibacter massiliensis]|uniref:helix-turn-helix domain-containing protein n=1 Tax=Konateibacter massiliensis TaxID=2002841 RepID=UPI0015D4B45A|nr:helix-turn-helix domain-containing protein [Konateibacter massiliensis]